MSRRTTVAVLLLLAAPLQAQVPGGDAASSPRDAWIDSLAQSLVDEATPGLALSVVHQGRVVHRGTYGVASIEGGEPVDEHTRFYVASTAKMFTAAAVLSLVDDGRIALDDPAARWLAVVPGYARDVTVRQLLDHTAGLVDHYDVGGEERGYTNADVLRILADADSLLSPPGTRARYSNSGYVLLSLLVETVTGVGFDEYLERRFFAPFGMSDAFVAVDGPPAIARAVGHSAREDGFRPLDYNSATTGAGGVYASLADLERWHAALRSGRVISDSLLHVASRPPELPGGRLTPFGMGWLAEFAGRGPLADRWYVFAYGTLRGFRAVYQWYPGDDLAVIWMANAASEDVLRTLMAIPPYVLAGVRDAGP
jgi:CubicO group peptidase (beta-lactamase class C family)